MKEFFFFFLGGGGFVGEGGRHSWGPYLGVTIVVSLPTEELMALDSKGSASTLSNRLSYA